MFICTVVVIGNRGSAGIDLGPRVHLRNGGIVTLRTNTQTPRNPEPITTAIEGHRHGGLPSSHTHRL